MNNESKHIQDVIVDTFRKAKISISGTVVREMAVLYVGKYVTMVDFSRFVEDYRSEEKAKIEEINPDIKAMLKESDQTEESDKKK